MGLDPEPYYRKNGIPSTLRWRLTPLEREYFRGVRGQRFELNAILPDTRRIEYIEEKLKENGVRGKVIPPDGALADKAIEMFLKNHAAWVDELVEKMFLEKLKEELAEEFKEHYELDASSTRKGIEEKFKEDDARSWRGALDERLRDIKEKQADALKKAVKEKVRESLKDEEE